MCLGVNCTFLLSVLISCIVSCNGNPNHLQDMTITDVPVRIYPDNFPCGHGLSGSLSELSNVVTPTGNCVVCNGKEYIDNNNFTEFYPSQHCAEVSYQCGNGTEYYFQRLLEQLGSISEFIHSYPSGCLEILQENNLAPSGFYKIRAFNGTLISVYCDMEGSNCDGVGGWMRVGYLDMSQPGATCPPGLSTYYFNGINYPLCDRPHICNSHCNDNGCSSALFSPLNISYQHVCGRVRGYQYRITDGIYPNNGGGVNSLCGPYVDGISITTRGATRQHLWTYICGRGENEDNWESCPCNTGSSATVPSFVGNNYYCESGADDGHGSFPDAIFTDALWDGQNCDLNERPCCNDPKMPWFVRTLSQSTTDDIELRLCTSEGYPDETVPVDFFEFYVR